MMYCIQKKKSFVSLLIFTMVLFSNFSSFIAPKVYAQSGILTFGTTVTGMLTATNSEDVYTLNVTQSGRVSLDMVSQVMGTTNLEFTDNSDNRIFSGSTTGSDTNPQEYKEWVDVEPGTYHVKVSNNYYSEDTGSYTLLATFASSGAKDIEPNNGVLTAQPLAIDKATTGFLSQSDTDDYYKVTVTETGTLYVDVTTYVDGYTNLELLDSNNKVVRDGYVESSLQNPKLASDWADVPPGTYYVHVYSTNPFYGTGKYNLTVSFDGVGVVDAEPNNVPLKAEAIKFMEPKLGYFTYDDVQDVYKFTMPKDGKVDIYLESEIGYESNTDFFDTGIDVEDAQGNSYLHDSINGNYSNPAEFDGYVNLKAGTYYITISRNQYEDYNTGMYYLGIKSNSLNPTLTVNTVKDNSTTITGKTNPNTLVYAGINNKEYKATSKADGTFSIVIPKQKAGTQIFLYVENQYGYTTKMVTVVDKTPPAKPTISKVTTKSTKITGRTEAYAKVYIKVGSKNYTVQANRSGNYTLNIKKQKKNTVIVIYAKDKAGNISSKVTVKVK